jgi:hypothetical protein
VTKELGIFEKESFFVACFMIFDSYFVWVCCTTHKLQLRVAHVAPLLRHLLFSSTLRFNSTQNKPDGLAEFVAYFGSMTPGLLRSYRNTLALLSFPFGLTLVNRYSICFSSFQSINKDLSQA